MAAALQDRLLEQDVVDMVLANFPGQYVPILLQGWIRADGTEALPPEGVLVPTSEHPEGWDRDQVHAAFAVRRSLLLPGTFQAVGERDALRRFVALMGEDLQALHPIVVQLLSSLDARPLTRETMQAMVARHTEITRCGIHSVLVNPSLEPRAFRSLVEEALLAAQMQEHRMQRMLDLPERRPDEEQVRLLERRLFNILWEESAKLFMPHLPAADPTLVEEPGRVGGYRFLYRFKTSNDGMVYIAEPWSGNGQQIVIKVIIKTQVHSMPELEGIYREFVLMSRMLNHPHIVRCRGCLSSHEHLYLLYDLAGRDNLHSYTLERPGRRLATEEALHCFDQFAGALAYCHQQRVAHRDFALEHVIVQEQSMPGGGVNLYCRIVDFRSAVVVRAEGALSSTTCGMLPCAAPEVLAGEVYEPMLADRWSAGAVLLEIAGGLSTMQQMVCWSGDNVNAAMQVRQAFSRPGCHAAALGLTVVQGREQVLVHRLQALLQPDAGSRVSLAELVGGGTAQPFPNPPSRTSRQEVDPYT